MAHDRMPEDDPEREESWNGCEFEKNLESLKKNEILI